MKYTETHEWVSQKEDSITMGITNHAQEELSDVVHVELPEVGKKVEKGKPMMVIESVKAASDIYAPVEGEVVEVNEKLNDSPELVNSDAEGDGWLAKIKPSKTDELEGLLSLEGYKELLSK